MPTLDQAHSRLETWRNTQPGLRWYIAFDMQGRETTKTVNGHRTFTISTFERQVNQERAATPELDLFRNGGFVIVRGGGDTKKEEIESPDSKTDAEIADMVIQVIGGSETIQSVTKEVGSTFTLNRILDQLVAEDAPKSAISHVTELISEKEPTTAQFHEVVQTKPGG